MAQILIIDDDSFVRTMLRMTLDHFGHKVVEAPNGREGIRLFKESEPDLVITDMVMPDTGGLEVVIELQKTQPLVKIIAISGGDRADKRCQLGIAKNMGASAILTKPFSTRVLMRTIDALLSGAPSDDDNIRMETSNVSESFSNNS